MADLKLQHLPNEELLKRYQEADAEAFGEFFSRNRRLVFHYLYSKLGNTADAEEAFQTTFFRVHRYILKYDTHQNALGWVMTIARNVSIDLRPRHAPTKSLEDTPESSLATASNGLLEARSALESLLSALEPRERRLIERRFMNEDSFEEIAADERWSVANTRQRVSRLLRRLRTEMTEFST